MANDGIKIVLTLKQVNSVTFLPTGLTENNTPGTPEYIPPYTDYADCPVSYSLACPVAIFQGNSGSIGFEFSLYDSVVMNPQVSSVNVLAISQSATKGSASFHIPNSTPNYFSGSIFVTHGTYTSSIQYMSGSSILTTCTNTSSIIVS